MNIQKDENYYAVVFTDSLGKFDYTSMRASFFGCPRVLLSFEEEGYNNIHKKFKSCCTDNVIIKLEKE
jgi:hypothetical protein